MNREKDSNLFSYLKGEIWRKPMLDFYKLGVYCKEIGRLWKSQEVYFGDVSMRKSPQLAAD